MHPNLVRLLAAVTVAAPLITVASLDDAHRAAPRQEPAAAAIAYGKLPLAFEANGGRTDGRVDYIARGAGWSLFLTPGASVLNVGHHVLRTRLTGAAPVRGVAEAKLPGVVNSLIGRDRSKWRTGIPTYSKVRYRSVYPGIDLVYYGRERRLEYDFVVAPGANPKRIGMDLAGASRLRVSRTGDLVVSAGGHQVKQLKPVAYQQVGATRTPVAASYTLRGNHVGLRIGDYDRSRRLVIDPLLAYSTFIGGASSEIAQGIAVDTNGSAYITGDTTSNDFPLQGAFRTGRSNTDGFLTKLNPSGTAIVYSTFVGGTGTDNFRAIDVDDTGAAYLVGETQSSDLPVPGAADSSLSGGDDAFALKINAAGTGVTWGTYIGGSSGENALGVTVDANHDAYVVGYTLSPSTNASTTFPVSSNAYQTTYNGNTDQFLTVLNYNTLRIILHLPPLAFSYSTYLGGAAIDYAQAVDVDSTGNVFVGGFTYSSDFPVKNQAQSDQTGVDGTVAKFDRTQSTAANTLLYSTYFGGSGTDEINDLSVTSAGIAHVVGDTTSADLPSVVATQPFDHVASSTDEDGFVSQLSSASTPAIQQTAYLGGDAFDSASGIQIRAGTNLTEYIVGRTKSGPSFPMQNDISQVTPTLNDPQMFVIKRYPGASSPAVFSTLMGGLSNDGDYGQDIAVDSAGRAYVTGYAGFDFPTTAGAARTNFGGGSSDAVAFRIDPLPPHIDPPSPADGALLTTNSVSFYYNVNEADRTFKCSGVDANHMLTNTSPASCNIPPKTYSGLADGTHTFQVTALDQALDPSIPTDAQRTFTIDTQPPAPFDLVDPADMSTTNTQPTLKWNQATDAATAITYHLLIDGNDVQSVASDACSGGVCSAQLTTPLVTGLHTWRVRAVDAASHSTDSVSQRSLTAVEPPVAKLTVSPNPALVGSTVTFDATGSADASHVISKYEWDLDGDGNYELDTADAGKTTKSYDSAQTVTVSVRVTDAAGGTDTESAELKITTLSTPGGLLGVTVNNGAQYTKSPDVTVSSVYPSTTTTMVFSNDGGFLNAVTFAPAKDTKWKLDSSGPERLPKTIYVRFFTGPFPSETFQDDIILDETPPKVDSATVSAAAPSSAAAVAVAAKSKTRSWKAKLKATDSNSGVQYVQLTSNKKRPGKLLKYKKKLTVKSPKRPKWVRARDKAGNYSRWRKAR